MNFCQFICISVFPCNSTRSFRKCFSGFRPSFLLYIVVNFISEVKHVKFNYTTQVKLKTVDLKINTDMLSQYLVFIFNSIGWQRFPATVITDIYLILFSSHRCRNYFMLTYFWFKVASDNIRGALGSLFILSQNMGYLLVYVAGDLLSFTALLWICTALPAVFLVGFIFMPETPVFLVKQGKIEVSKNLDQFHHFPIKYRMIIYHIT